MLQSLTGRLNRLNDVREIGDAIAAELRSLVDYHNCRVFVADGDGAPPGRLSRRSHLGTGMRSRSTSSATASARDHGPLRRARRVDRRRRRRELRVRAADRGHRPDRGVAARRAAPLRRRVVGVIVVSKLGLDQFDEDDVRLLEVLAGHAAVAVENASLYEAARREAESATSLLEFGRELATLVELDDIAARVTELSAEILGSRNTSFYVSSGRRAQASGRARPFAGDRRGALGARRLSADRTLSAPARRAVHARRLATTSR